MKFGTVLISHWDGDREPSSIYQTMLDNVLLAEKLGYYSIYTTEHHFANDPEYLPFDWDQARFKAYDLAPDPITLFSYFAARTSKIRFGTGVMLVNYDNPIRFAERAAMLDVLSGGRLELGLGRGGGQPHSSIFGCPNNDQEGQEYYRESLQIILKAWSGERFEFHGKHFDFGPIQLVPPPVQRPYLNSNATGIPLFTSTGNHENLIEAAAQSISHITVTGAWGEGGIERYNERQATYEEACRANGIDPAKHLYPGQLFQFVAPSDAEAEDVAEEYISRYIAHVEAHYQRQRSGGGTFGTVLAAGQGVDKVRELARLSIDNNLVGSPKTVAEKLAAFMEKVPTINYLSGIVNAGSPPLPFIQRSLELFAHEVMPHFADTREPVRT
ncbi:MAG: LLM class flavin-dependent oxidoreductase [Sphingobium sp.]